MQRQIIYLAVGALALLGQTGWLSAFGQVDSRGIEIGGSDFVTYNITDYPMYNPQNAPQANFQPLVLRPTVGTLHYDPARVEAELAAMRSRGQQKIALAIFYTNLVPTNYPPGAYGNGYDGVFGIFIDSRGGQMPPQQQANLSLLLSYIKNCGFNELQVRFAAGGPNDPKTWNVWNSRTYFEDLSFISKESLHKSPIHSQLG